MLACTLRIVAVVGSSVIVFLVSAALAAQEISSGAEPVGIAQATTGTDQTPVHVVDQNDPSQYDEVWDWGAEWRMLRWYGQTLVIAVGVLLLPALWCCAVLCVGARKVARAHRQLARAHRVEAAVDATFHAIDAERQHLEREVARVL